MGGLAQEAGTAARSVTQAASFFAQAYTLNGETIISYRGTDDLAVDTLTGYGTGSGIALSTQAEMALRFYQSVANSTDPRLANITLTGHSLGGGLAGNDNAVLDEARAA